MKSLIYLIAFTFVIAACSSPGNDTTNTAADEDIKSGSESNKGQAYIQDDGSTPNILQIALGSADHTTLVAAVQAAELENALVNAGPLMVFAPTNDAFAALPEGTVETLLKPENKATLADILLFHVTPGKYEKDFIKNFKHLGQANNDNVPVTIGEDGEVLVGGARILGSVVAGNGIVHVVDKVMLPPTEE
ncbi:MAG: fasciclin domain-containing protein [Bacteroidetes bacterium]|nr:fasciclin domain-containing protein [Bacteroidota bacterium]